MKIAIFLLLSLTPLLSFSQKELFLVKYHVNKELYVIKYHVNMGYTSGNNLIIDGSLVKSRGRELSIDT